MSDIVRDPDIMSGIPCIAGTRIPAKAVWAFYEAGHSTESIMDEFPTLGLSQITAAIDYCRSRPAPEIQDDDVEAVARGVRDARYERNIQAAIRDNHAVHDFDPRIWPPNVEEKTDARAAIATLLSRGWRPGER